MTQNIEIHLLRHAHSSHAVAGERDHGRGLDDRGAREVQLVRERLARELIALDQIVCSTARRARLTLEPLLPLWPDASVRYDDGIYALGPEAYSAAVAEAADARRLLIVGHNPTIQAVLHHWCPNDGDRLATGIGTAVWATVLARRDGEGSRITGRLVRLLAPR